MTFEQLLYVVELSNQHSLQKTSQLLHISTSGLSQAISQLEKELGIKLFERTHQGSVLTKEGREMLSSFAQLLQFKNQIINTAGQLADQQHVKSIRIQYANTMLRPFMTEYFQMTKQHHNQQIHLNIACQQTDTIIKNVREQKIDAGFIAINPQNTNRLQGLSFSKVHQSHLRLLMSPENPLVNHPQITLDELKQQRFSNFNDPFNDQIFARLQYLCGPLQEVVRTDDGWSIYQTITRLNTVCLGRDWQSQFSSYKPLKELPYIDISNFVDDNFSLGWLTNPSHALNQPTKEFLKRVAAHFQ